MKKIGLQLLIALSSVAVAHGQSTSSPTARLVIRSGIVEVQRGNFWLPIAFGDSLNPGERIRTAAGSSGAVEIAPGKVVTLNEQSQVLLGPLNGSPAVQLESGSMKIFSASEIQVGAKDTLLEAAEGPLDLELGYQADKLNLTVFNGAVRSGSIIIRGGNQDPTVRTYTAGRPDRRNDNRVENPTYYLVPYFFYGNPDPNAGRIVPPVVNNPTHPGYRPTQIVPPMADPIRVPVTKR